MPTKYSREQAEKIIKEISCAPDGRIVLSEHFTTESGPTRQIDIFDALKVLREGQVVSQPEYASRYKNWKCKMDGQDVEGDALTLAVAFDPVKREVCVITGWG
jgi:hypothetical protein